MTGYLTTEGGMFGDRNAPRTGDMLTPLAPTDQGAPTLSAEEFDALSRSAFDQVNQRNTGMSAWEQVRRFSGGVLTDTVDSVWASPLNPVPGSDRGDVWELASPEQRNFYERNKPAIEGTSAVVGGLGTAIAAEALIIPRIAGALASSTAITSTRAWQYGRRWSKPEAMRDMLEAQKQAIRNGEKMSMGAVGGAKLFANRVATGAAITTRTLPFDYAVMWNNEAFNSGNVAEEAFWIGLTGGLGAVGGAIASRGIARRSMNKPWARDEIARNTSMAGVSNSLLNDSFIADPVRRRNPSSGGTKDIRHTKDSTAVTHWLIGSRANLADGIETPANVQGKVDGLRNSFKAAAEDGFKRIVAKGLAGANNVIREPLSSSQEIRYLVNEAPKTDPYVVFGMDELALVDDDFRNVVKDRKKHIDELWRQSQAQLGTEESRAMAKQAAKMKRQELFAYANGSWYDPESELVDAMRLHDEKGIRAQTRIEGDAAIFRSQRAKQTEMAIDANMVPRRGSDRINVARMNHRDRFALYSVANRLMNHRARQQKKTIIEVADEKANDWFQLDMLDDLMDVDESLVRLAPGNTQIVDRASLQRHALRLKARAVLKDLGPTAAIDDEVRLRYNLPSQTTMERLEDPHGDAFRKWLESAASDAGTADELAQGLKGGMAFHGLDLLPNDTPTQQMIKGNGLNFNRYDPKGDGNSVWMRPMLATFEPRDVLSDMMRQGHEERLIREKAEMMQVLQMPVGKSGHVAKMTQQLSDAPALADAHAVNTLHDAQSTGLGSRVGQALSEFLPSRFKHRDNPIILAASRLQEMVDRMGTRAYVEAVEASGLSEALKKYSTHGGLGLRAELDQFVSLRPGWDIKSPEYDEALGRWVFELDDTPTNKKLLGLAADDVIEEGELLRNMQSGDTITLSDEAMNVMNQYWENLSDELLRGTNQIRKANNQSPITRKRFHVPAVNTQGKRVGFLQNPQGEIVPGVAVVEATDQGFARQSKRLLDEYGDGYQVKPKEQIAATRDIWDMEAMDWIDHGASTALRGGKQEGGLNPYFVKDGAFLDMLEDAKGKYRTQSRDTLKTIMKHPIQIARMNSAVERQAYGAAPVNQAKKGIAKPQRNIYDEYEEALTGSSASFDETGLLSEMADAVADGIDSTVFAPINHIADIATQWGVKPGAMRKAKSHKQIVETLSEHSPYKTADEWVEAQGVRKPANIRQTSQKLNELATNLVLRWDPLMAHASLNMLGLIPTILGNVKAGAAPATMAFDVKGRKVPMHDGIAVIKGGIADMFNVRRGKGGDVSHRDWAKMVANGDASQSAFEYHLMTGSVRSRADWEQYAQKLDKHLAWASDGSENLSRQISHFVGLRLARYQGIKDIDDAHNFAREFANAAIADYAPSNRPELYQTSLGSVFGLFQSYAVNQFSKMFHWLEKGDYAAFGTQAAAQAAMFGLPGTYGASAIFEAHDKFFQDSGEPSLLDNMYAQFGPTIGNALAHGGIAEIGKVALWTRGGMEPRMPIITDGMMPPGVDMIKRFSKSITGSIGPFLNRVPEEALPAAIENIQREMPNRMLKGIIGVMQGGYETDRNGNVMTENQTWLDSIARVAGVRSARQQAELQVYYSGRDDMSRDAVRRKRVRMRLRTNARRAAEKGATVDPMEYFDDYVASGGMPQSFKSWFKQTIRDAADPRSMQDMRRNLESPRARVQLWRYGGYGAFGIDDPSSAP